MANDLVNYDEAWAAQATAAAADEPVAANAFLSTRGGILRYGEEEMPGNQACVIILDMVKENTFYGEKYDPDNAAAPLCYAFGRGAEEMGPHPSMQIDLEYFQPQHESCEGCPMNMWGTADTGKGKACQNRRRLAVIPAGAYIGKRGSRDFDLDLFTDPKDFISSEVAFIKLPVMSVKDWAKYVLQLSAGPRRPPHGVYTRMFLEPDPKSQYRVHFEMVEEVPNELAAILMERHAQAVAAPFQGYRPPEAKDAAPPASTLKGLRRAR